MILPLQTWQHQDPKGLWPAIGGLAVLAHIGVIGMSVPYLLSLQEAQNVATAIPIELSVEPSTNLAPAEAPATETPDTESDKLAIADSQAVAESAIAPNQKAGQKASFSARSHTFKPHISKPPTVSPTVESPSTPEKTPEQPDNTADPEQTSTENEEAKAIEGSETPEPFETTKPSDDTTEKPDVTPEASPQFPEASPEGIQEIANGDPLPPPPDNSQVGSQVGQSLRLRTVLSPEYDPAEGSTRPGPQPELISTRDEWLLHSEEEGCGAVSALAAQSTLTYRIGIDPDGTIYSAKLLLGQDIAPDSEDDQAVACLIQKAGILFVRPGISEDDKSIDDSLLMTFELSEQ